jgi:hypothetical protein
MGEIGIRKFVADWDARLGSVEGSELSGSETEAKAEWTTPKN